MWMSGAAPGLPLPWKEGHRAPHAEGASSNFLRSRETDVRQPSSFSFRIILSIMQQDRVSGASEIEQKIIEFISPYLGTEELFEKCRELLSTYPSMGSLWNIANFAFLHEEGAQRHFNEMIEAGKQVVYQGVHAVKKHVTVLTHSRSATLSKILLACADKGITVICSESRPGYEGRKLAGNCQRGELRL
ncbi:MAG TPA: hypothetical protein ENG06_04280 [Thermoplasmatales archaeon]|nr:hypothetical protein [Thermoplasmatales archaeon]